MRLIAPMKKLLLRFTHSRIPLLFRAPASLYLQDKKKGKEGKRRSRENIRGQQSLLLSIWKLHYSPINFNQAFPSAQRQTTEQEAAWGPKDTFTPECKSACPLPHHAQWRLVNPQPWGKVHVFYECIQMSHTQFRVSYWNTFIILLLPLT